MLLPLFLLLAFEPPEFRSQELARELKGGYQVLPADLNGDGRTDLIALASGMSELVWFENPGRAEAEWPRHVLASGFRQMINVAAYQRGPGAIPDLLLAHEFSNNPKQSRGTVSLLEASKSDRSKSTWKRRDIEDRPTSHRLKLANGKFINAPLADPESAVPNYEGTVPLVEYDTATLAPRVVSAAEKGVWHGLSIGDFNHDGREDIFTAAFNGIAVYVAQRDGNYERIALDAGSRAAWPKSGASEIAQVRLNRKRRPDFVVATIEPWHGNELVVLEGKGKQWKRTWKRTVLDNTFEEGHALVAADFDDDGQDEILYGARKGGGALRLAWRDKAKGTWKIEKLAEGKIAVNSCATFDVDRDGGLDFACIGGATQNLVLYRNTREK